VRVSPSNYARDGFVSDARQLLRCRAVARLYREALLDRLSAAPKHSAGRQPALNGGSIVVQTAKYIRYVYPARGASFSAYSDPPHVLWQEWGCYGRDRFEDRVATGCDRPATTTLDG